MLADEIGIYREMIPQMPEGNLVAQVALLHTECGPVRGVLSPSGGASFRSIPYARPPVGALRWQPPVPLTGAACWSGTLDARHFQPACLQAARYGAPAASRIETAFKWPAPAATINALTPSASFCACAGTPAPNSDSSAARSPVEAAA